MPEHRGALSATLHVVPLQLLAYRTEAALGVAPNHLCEINGKARGAHNTAVHGVNAAGKLLAA